MMKKWIAMLMALTVLFAVSAVCAEETKEIALGTSHLKITTPVPYVMGEMTTADADENHVACYTSAQSPVSFDVYQRTKADGETLESVADAEAMELGTEIFEDVLENGILIEGYYATGEYEDGTCETCTILAEDGNDFVKMVFRLNGDAEAAALEMTAIVATLTQF